MIYYLKQTTLLIVALICFGNLSAQNTYTRSANSAITMSKISDDGEVQKHTIIRDTVSIKKTITLRDTVYILYPKKFPIALKTNLLYDAVGALNLEVEVPIGKKWSVGAELIHPWWSSSSNNFTDRLRLGHLSVNYWLGDREKLDYLTGWSIGLFGGYGDFDFQFWDMEGTQGEIINTGVSIGYAHSINKKKKNNLHLHYQIGFGYSSIDYREYTKYYNTEFGDVKVFDSPWLEKRITWFGPTQAEVSLVWMLNLGGKEDK